MMESNSCILRKLSSKRDLLFYCISSFFSPVHLLQYRTITKLWYNVFSKEALENFYKYQIFFLPMYFQCQRIVSSVVIRDWYAIFNINTKSFIKCSIFDYMCNYHSRYEHLDFYFIHHNSSMFYLGNSNLKLIKKEKFKGNLIHFACMSEKYIIELDSAKKEIHMTERISDNRTTLKPCGNNPFQYIYSESTIFINDDNDILYILCYFSNSSLFNSYKILCYFILKNEWTEMKWNCELPYSPETLKYDASTNLFYNYNSRKGRFCFYRNHLNKNELSLFYSWNSFFNTNTHFSRSYFLFQDFKFTLANTKQNYIMVYDLAKLIPRV